MAISSLPLIVINYLCIYLMELFYECFTGVLVDLWFYSMTILVAFYGIFFDRNPSDSWVSPLFLGFLHELRRSLLRVMPVTVFSMLFSVELTQ